VKFNFPLFFWEKGKRGEGRTKNTTQQVEDQTALIGPRPEKKRGKKEEEERVLGLCS